MPRKFILRQRFLWKLVSFFVTVQASKTIDARPKQGERRRMAKIGETVARAIAGRGIDVVFGIPGIHTLELYRGLRGSGLRHVTPRHEQGAGFMADGYARMTGEPAAVFAITGPGLTNLLTPMAQALNDSIPMLVVTANNPSAAAGRGLGALHDLKDQSALASGVARWSRRAASQQDIAEALDEAVATFAAARPGPVHIEIATDVLAAESPSLFRAPAQTPPPPAPMPLHVAHLEAELAAATRPVLILGGGAVGAGDDARKLAERLGAPTLLTSNARGLLPPDHPLLFGGMLHTHAARDLIAQADAVLAIGTEFSETDWTFYETPPLIFAQHALIRVDIDADQLHRPPKAHMTIAADAAETIRALLDRLEQKSGAPNLAPFRAAAASEIPQRYARHAPLIEGIWSTLPDAVVIGDSTEPAYYGLAAAAPPRPRSWWTSATGFGCLGYALPAAIGAKIANPRRPVIALVGDGGALFTLPELAAAVEAHAHVIVMVWNNSGYGEIREAMRDQRIEPEGVNLSPVDFQALARGFGAHFGRVNGPGYLEDALRAAIMRRGPTVLELRDDFWFGAH
jgi:acetolactate synthase-1/2/3 large subunit